MKFLGDVIIQRDRSSHTGMLDGTHHDVN
jgi:hypothetical protein